MIFYSVVNENFAKLKYNNKRIISNSPFASIELFECLIVANIDFDYLYFESLYLIHVLVLKKVY